MVFHNNVAVTLIHKKILLWNIINVNDEMYYKFYPNIVLNNREVMVSLTKFNIALYKHTNIF